MSRCFSYPPPGYEKNEALIESIKLQKERENAKKERRKERKREKKEKSRGENDKKHSLKKRRHGELSQSNPKGGDYIKKKREDETEQLEKSSLTEEQGPPPVQNLYDSSDSTQNSSKRKKHESSNVSCDNNHGNGLLRIRLPLMKHRDPEPCLSSEKPCFSGRTEASLAKEETKAAHVNRLHLKLKNPKPPASSEQPSFSGRTETTSHAQEETKTVQVNSFRSKHKDPEPPVSSEQPALLGRIKTTLAQEEIKTAHGTSNISRGRRSDSSSCSCDCEMDLQLKNLIVNWNPPPLQLENPEFDDQDWLFGPTRRRRHVQSGAGGQVGSEDLGHGSALCSWPPRARYLPEAGVYALPYVVPF